MPRRRLQDRIEALVTKAIATDDSDEVEAVIQQLREALHEHAKRLRRLAADKLSSYPTRASQSSRNVAVV